MSLILYRTYPDDPIQANQEHFWRVTSKGVYIGSIVYHPWQQAPLWHWTIQVHDPCSHIGKQGVDQTRDDAMKQFRSAWDICRA